MLSFPRRKRLRSIRVLALPIVGGMVSQNLLNLVDAAMVGALGESALAAVGVGSFATLMLSTFVVGIASGGVQAMSARRVGEGRQDQAALVLNGGLAFALVVGAPAAALLVAVTPRVFACLNGDPEVVRQGIPYMQARLVAITAISMNFAFRGYWNGVQRSELYMRALIVMHVANVVLDWMLIFGNFGAPALGTFGAGVASSAATVLGTFYYFVLAWSHARARGFLSKLPDAHTLATMVRLGVPSSPAAVFILLRPHCSVLDRRYGWHVRAGCRDSADEHYPGGHLARCRPWSCCSYPGWSGAWPQRARRCYALGLGRRQGGGGMYDDGCAADGGLS